MLKITFWAAKIAPLMRQGFLKTIKAEISGKRIAATEGMWIQDGGIQIPSKYKLYEGDSSKDNVRNSLESKNHFNLSIFFQNLSKWAYIQGVVCKWVGVGEGVAY